MPLKHLHLIYYPYLAFTEEKKTLRQGFVIRIRQIIHVYVEEIFTHDLLVFFKDDPCFATCSMLHVPVIDKHINMINYPQWYLVGETTNQ